MSVKAEKAQSLQSPQPRRRDMSTETNGMYLHFQSSVNNPHHRFRNAGGISKLFALNFLATDSLPGLDGDAVTPLRTLKVVVVAESFVFFTFTFTFLSLLMPLRIYGLTGAPQLSSLPFVETELLPSSSSSETPLDKMSLELEFDLEREGLNGGRGGISLSLKGDVGGESLYIVVFLPFL